MLATLSAFTVSLANVSNAADKPPLSIEFLEYLGAMVEHDGRLLDPMDMEAEDVLKDASSVQPVQPVSGSESVQNGEKPIQTHVEHRSRDDSGGLVP